MKTRILLLATTLTYFGTACDETIAPKQPDSFTKQANQGTSIEPMCNDDELWLGDRQCSFAPQACGNCDISNCCDGAAEFSHDKCFAECKLEPDENGNLRCDQDCILECNDKLAACILSQCGSSSCAALFGWGTDAPQTDPIGLSALDAFLGLISSVDFISECGQQNLIQWCGDHYGVFGVGGSSCMCEYCKIQNPNGGYDCAQMATPSSECAPGEDDDGECGLDGRGHYVKSCQNWPNPNSPYVWVRDRCNTDQNCVQGQCVDVPPLPTSQCSGGLEQCFAHQVGLSYCKPGPYTDVVQRCEPDSHEPGCYRLTTVDVCCPSKNEVCNAESPQCCTPQGLAPPNGSCCPGLVVQDGVCVPDANATPLCTQAGQTVCIGNFQHSCVYDWDNGGYKPGDTPIDCTMWGGTCVGDKCAYPF